MRIEAKYYHFANNKIVCTLCPNECRLTEEQIGACRARKVIDGRLITMAYANPCAVHIDPIEKKPLNHFYPGSNTFSLGIGGCLLHCKNCQNFSISQSYPEDLQQSTFLPEEIIAECKSVRCNSISYTYTEPFASFEYTLDTAKRAHCNGIKNIIVSSGYVNEEPLRELIPYIDAANIDLKCFSRQVYKDLCKGDLDVVLRNLKILNQSSVWLEITNLIIPGYSDDMETIELMCGWLIANGFENVPIHFSRFYPEYKLEHLPPTPQKDIEQAVSIAKNSGLRYVYNANIHAPNDTECPQCHTSLIKRNGYNVQIIAAFTGICPKCGNIIHGRF